MDRGDWQVTVHGVTKESDVTEHYRTVAAGLKGVPQKTMYKG